MDRVFFFDTHVRCLHCNESTQGVVWAQSARIDCDQCGEPLFDATEMDGGTLVILELDDATWH